ncbi:MAG: parallel beta-helix repeat protein [Dokdonia sp.]|jgi:parallel beta-helix repeat protein
MTKTSIRGGKRGYLSLSVQIEAPGCDGKSYFTLSFSSSHRVLYKEDFAFSLRGLSIVPGEYTYGGSMENVIIEGEYSYIYTTKSLPKFSNEGDYSFENGNGHNYSFENGAIYEINSDNEKEAIYPGKAIIQFQNGKYSGLMTTREGFNNLKDNEKLYLSPGSVYLTDPLELYNLNNIQIIGNNTSLVTTEDSEVVSLMGIHTVYVEDVLMVHRMDPEEGCYSNCLNVRDSSDIHIKNCRFDGSGIIGISLNKITNATIENNQFYNCVNGFSAELSKNIIVKNNNFTENRGQDIIGDRTQFVNDFTSENSFRKHK